MTHEVARIFALFPRSGKTALDVPLATHGFAAGFCNIRDRAESISVLGSTWRLGADSRIFQGAKRQWWKVRPSRVTTRDCNIHLPQYCLVRAARTARLGIPPTCSEPQGCSALTQAVALR